MRVLIIAHVGETFGHLVRGLSIARELANNGCSIEIASGPTVEEFIELSNLSCDFHPVRWNWSHNSCELDGLSSKFLVNILETIDDLLKVVKQSQPDLIVSLPGFASAQIARSYGIPHISVIHGPHLAPMIQLQEATKTEAFIIETCKRVCLGPLNGAFQALNKVRGLPWMNYETFIHSELIYVPQPGLPLKHLANVAVTNFARGSIGPSFQGPADYLEGSCYVTFGSGNRSDITRIILLARQMFPTVIATTGTLNIGPFPDGVITRPYISSSSLAGRVAAVISHGGIGTVGTFAEWGTPQLIVPTEIDQATMAMYASRSRIADHIGLDSFLNRSRLGRQLPDFQDTDLLTAIDQLRNKPIPTLLTASSGAEEIAQSILKSSLGTLPVSQFQKDRVHETIY